MTTKLFSWAPAALLTLGALLTVGVDGQRSLDLRRPLASAVPGEIDGHRAYDIKVSKAEQRVAGMSSYVLRSYSPLGNQADQAVSNFSVYVGYYAQQMRGKTIHSPKNCLPGAGWEALTARTESVPTRQGNVTVNSYILKRKDQKALVLYWYQGRGRIEANEYRVKWNLLRDAATKRRSDEALVRIVVPVKTTEKAALNVASRVAYQIIPSVSESLPAS